MPANSQNVQWPINVVDVTGADLAGPTKQLLKALGLAVDQPGEGNVPEVGPFAGTPPSIQVIKAGSLALSKGWTTVSAVVGGGAGVVAFINGVWGEADEPLRIAYLIAATILLSVAFISVALIVRADLDARAHAAAGEYHARAAIASTFISGLQSVVSSQTRVVGATKYWIRKSVPGESLEVLGITKDPNEGLVFLTQGDRVPASQVKDVGSIDQD